MYKKGSISSYCLFFFFNIVYNNLVNINLYKGMVRYLYKTHIGF